MRTMRRAYNKACRERHGESIKLSQKKWREATGEMLLARKRAYYQQNRSSILKKKRAKNEFRTLRWFEQHLDWYALRHHFLTPRKQRQWCHLLINRALLLGEIEKPTTCTRCPAQPAREDLHAHHPDYS
jgi:hypothetical protein